MKLDTKFIKLECAIKSVKRVNGTLMIVADTKYGPATQTFSGPELEQLRAELQPPGCTCLETCPH